MSNLSTKAVTMRGFVSRHVSTAVEVVCIFLIAGGIAMIYIPAGVMALGALGLGVSVFRAFR